MGWRGTRRAAGSDGDREQHRLLMATVDTLPQPYRVLGLVHVSTAIAVGTFPTDRLMDMLEDEAASLGADGVIGIRITEVALPGVSRTRLIGQVTDHEGGTVVATALGTAVRHLCNGRTMRRRLAT